MPNILGILRTNSSYVFIGVGIVWLVVAVLAWSGLVLWPVVAFLASGVLLRMMPGRRFTWAWVVSTAVLGFLLSAYQVYAWAPFLGGTFSALAAGALAGFAVFAVVHLLLFYIGLRPSSAATSSASSSA
jgi:hypothetical protein